MAMDGKRGQGARRPHGEPCNDEARKEHGMPCFDKRGSTRLSGAPAATPVYWDRLLVVVITSFDAWGFANSRL